LLKFRALVTFYARQLARYSAY